MKFIVVVTPPSIYQYASYNKWDITDHQYKFENDPKNRCMYGEELQKFHDEDNLLLVFSTLMDLKKRYGKKKFYES